MAVAVVVVVVAAAVAAMAVAESERKSSALVDEPLASVCHMRWLTKSVGHKAKSRRRRRRRRRRRGSSELDKKPNQLSWPSDRLPGRLAAHPLAS